VTVVDFVSKELAPGELPSMEIETVDGIPQEVMDQLEKAGLKGKVKYIPSGEPKLKIQKQETHTYGTGMVRPKLVRHNI
jgi:hypothetical protein